jgi:hypothetical protein
MTVPQFSNNVLPVLLGMSRLPEFAHHQILIRHVIYDIESGEFNRAIQTLERAHAVFDLAPLNDLRRFIKNHSDSIALEVNTKPWRDVVSSINRPAQRWLGLTEALEVRQLLENCYSIMPSESVAPEPVYEHRVEYVSEPDPVKASPTQSQPSGVGTQIQTDLQQTNPTQRPVLKRINLRVAVDTFVVTLLLAVLMTWLLK